MRTTIRSSFTSNLHVLLHVCVCVCVAPRPPGTTMDANKSTAEFAIPWLKAEHGGVWECRVSTNGGQDSRKFNLTVRGQNACSVCVCVRVLFYEQTTQMQIIIATALKRELCSVSVWGGTRYYLLYHIHLPNQAGPHTSGDKFSHVSAPPEPPVPATPPQLQEKSSKQLVVMPMSSHRGDGPILSTKLLYKPMDNGDSWSSIIGEQHGGTM